MKVWYERNAQVEEMGTWEEESEASGRAGGRFYQSPLCSAAKACVEHNESKLVRHVLEKVRVVQQGIGTKEFEIWCSFGVETIFGPRASSNGYYYEYLKHVD